MRCQLIVEHKIDEGNVDARTEEGKKRAAQAAPRDEHGNEFVRFGEAAEGIDGRNENGNLGNLSEDVWNLHKVEIQNVTECGTMLAEV